MSLHDVVRGAAYMGIVEGFGVSPSPRFYLHNGPNRKTPAQMIAELRLHEGMKVTLLMGNERVEHTIRRIKNDQVFVDGLLHSINVYKICTEQSS